MHRPVADGSQHLVLECRVPGYLLLDGLWGHRNQLQHIALEATESGHIGLHGDGYELLGNPVVAILAEAIEEVEDAVVCLDALLGQHHQLVYAAAGLAVQPGKVSSGKMKSLSIGHSIRLG